MRWVHQLVESEDQWLRRRRHFQGCHARVCVATGKSLGTLWHSVVLTL